MAINKIINPFIGNLTIPYIEYVKSVKSIDGEYVKDSFDVEADPYTRVYNSKRRRDFIFNNLSVWSRDMLLAIQYIGIKDEQYLVLNYDKLKEKVYGERMYNKRRYDSTIREMISFYVIDYKDKDKNQFWYNADLICFGNRLRVFPESILKVDTIALY